MKSIKTSRNKIVYFLSYSNNSLRTIFVTEKVELNESKS